jgi:putative ABC transport system ATP-binding protein
MKSWLSAMALFHLRKVKIMNRVLEAKDLCKIFSNESVQQHVLKNLNITINQGDFAIIMGSSGSGKSTLLYALSGMDRPSLGSVCFSGEDISKYSNDKLAVFRRKNCGFVFQQNFLNDTMSVLDNIMISGLLVSKDRKNIVARAKDLLKSVSLTEEVYHKYPTQLSGGEAQRVALVRGMINQPTILFADEPTGALNSANSIQVLDILTELNRQGQTIIMVTHDIKAARRGNRVLYLQDGVILDESNLGEYVPKDKSRHEKLRTFLGEMGW